jgi:A/G-specific adenine glycosylase
MTGLKKTTLSNLMLVWYDDNARELPWRVPPAASKKGKRQTPYKVWLSEVMLQQTTVEAVKPRFRRFLKRWPSVKMLAAAPQEDVLSEWAGLGYYARARNLHACAQKIVTEHGGRFPKTEKLLRQLPGIGDYTAAAIAAIAFDQPSNVVDGNIERVMARLFAEETALPKAKPILKTHAARLTPAKRPGDYAQSLMDLGSLICTPKNPDCKACPLKRRCKGHKSGTPEAYPNRKAKTERPVRKAHIFVITNSKGEIFLTRRSQKGLLGGMLGLPTSEWREGRLTARKPFAAKWQRHDKTIRHSFTHFHLDMIVWQTHEGKPPLEGKFYPQREIKNLPTVFKKVLI